MYVAETPFVDPMFFHLAAEANLASGAIAGGEKTAFAWVPLTDLLATVAEARKVYFLSRDAQRRAVLGAYYPGGMQLHPCFATTMRLAMVRPVRRAERALSPRVPICTHSWLAVDVVVVGGRQMRSKPAAMDYYDRHVCGMMSCFRKPGGANWRPVSCGGDPRRRRAWQSWWAPPRTPPCAPRCPAACSRLAPAAPPRPQTGVAWRAGSASSTTQPRASGGRTSGRACGRSRSAPSTCCTGCRRTPCARSCWLPSEESPAWRQPCQPAHLKLRSPG